MCHSRRHCAGRRLLRNWTRLSVAAILALGTAGCGSNGKGEGGGKTFECPDGEVRASYEGTNSCRTACDSDADCPSGSFCRNQNACVPGTRGDDAGIDAVGPDTSDTSDDAYVCTSSGSRSCEWITWCAAFCPAGSDQNQCVQNCLKDGTCSGQKTYNRYTGCVERKCGSEGGSATCWQDHCEEPADACGLFGETDSCANVKKCRSTCYSKISYENPNASPERRRKLLAECITNCSNPTVDASRGLSKINHCRAKNCSSESSEPGCAFENCASEYRSCGLLGQRTCRDVSIALASCTARDHECLNKWYWTGSAQGLARYEKLSACRRENNCDQAQDIFICQLENCRSQAEACGLVGGVNSCSGDGDCDSHRTCENGTCTITACSDTLACIYGGESLNTGRISNCLYDSTAQVQKRALRYLDCVNANNCSGPNSTCAQNNCERYDKCSYR